MMKKKEDLNYGAIGVFILVCFGIMILMTPYEPITGSAVEDVTGSVTAAEFLSQNMVLAIVVFLIIIMGIIGMVFLVKHQKERQRILSQIPPEKLSAAEEYIKSTIAQGYSKEDVKAALMHQGWQESRVDAMMHHF
ncbi:hypothetical protein GF345_06015 [Candidatus Woesearchaeota archaeon]|nr:hypothetical protein [Candidatus Woesearchaeota archaeon]